MNDATLFELTMRTLWGESEYGFVVDAVANNIRGRQRINHENACDVLRIVFPDAKCSPRESDAGVEGTREVLIFDVRFEDNSSVLIIADQYGIGNGVEMLP